MEASPLLHMPPGEFFSLILPSRQTPICQEQVWEAVDLWAVKNESLPSSWVLSEVEHRWDAMREAQESVLGFAKPKWNSASFPHGPRSAFTSHGPLTRLRSPCQPLDKYIKCGYFETTCEPGQVLNDYCLTHLSFF